MLQSFDIFNVAGNLARHAGAMQARVAQNVSNADVKDFHALKITSFEAERQDRGFALQATRPDHFQKSAHDVAASSAPRESAAGVSLEEQMFHSVQAGRDHSRALAIYRHGMTVLRTTLGR